MPHIRPTLDEHLSLSRFRDSLDTATKRQGHTKGWLALNQSNASIDRLRAEENRNTDSHKCSNPSHSRTSFLSRKWRPKIRGHATGCTNVFTHLEFSRHVRDILSNATHIHAFSLLLLIRLIRSMSERGELGSMRLRPRALQPSFLSTCTCTCYRREEGHCYGFVPSMHD